MFYILRKNVEGEQWTTEVRLDDIVLSVEMTYFQPKAKRQWPRPKVKGQEAKSKEPKAKS